MITKSFVGISLWCIMCWYGPLLTGLAGDSLAYGCNIIILFESQWSAWQTPGSHNNNHFICWKFLALADSRMGSCIDPVVPLEHYCRPAAVGSVHIIRVWVTVSFLANIGYFLLILFLFGISIIIRIITANLYSGRVTHVIQLKCGLRTCFWPIFSFVEWFFFCLASEDKLGFIDYHD